jgi:energy-coupling factor transporter ATP-binding protein EcfA2
MPMPIKIKSLTISGRRGIQKPLNLQLDEKSILLYGENGSGKSSIADAVEWLYKDKIDHLSSEEIDLKEALRNKSIDKSLESSINIVFNKNLSVSRKLSYKNGKLTDEWSKKPGEYLHDSEKENLLIRYYLLRSFVNQTKNEKLKSLFDIIGFSEVTRIGGILKKTFNSIKNEIKIKNFEEQIKVQKDILINKIGKDIDGECSLIEKVNEAIKPLGLATNVKRVEDIDNVLKSINNSSEQKKLVLQQKFFEEILDFLSSLKNSVNINKKYEVFFKEFNNISNNIRIIKETYLADLLKAGDIVIEKKYYDDNFCPLCLQQKNIVDLSTEIKRRLKEVEKSIQLQEKFVKARKLVVSTAEEYIRKIKDMLDKERVNLDNVDNTKIRITLENLEKKFKEYCKAVKINIVSGEKLPAPDTLLIIDSDFEIQKEVLEKLSELDKTIKNDKPAYIFANVSAAKEAFLRIKMLEKEKALLEHQKKSIGLIFDKFIELQKKELKNFINTFSGSINEFYEYMNPREQFRDIQIVTIGENDDELKGIKLTYKFSDNNESDSAPQKYFSDGHLDCLGTAFFLASVFAFNKKNKFIIFDDVISSFDTGHRLRFAQLLFEKFKDYQIILLTHDKQWFDLISPKVKSNGWLVKTLKWDMENGTYLDSTPSDLKEYIEKKLTDGSPENLGNYIRQYLEHILKGICFNLEVNVPFRFNDFNEKRMVNELISGLRGTINKKGESSFWQEELKIIERISNCPLGNSLSHDNPSFSPESGDLKAWWEDIMKFEKIFICQDKNCKKPMVSIENYDNVKKKIRCSCGKIEYDWKK